MKNVLVTGGAGYLGSLLVPVLLKKGKSVTVYDLFIYGRSLPPHPNLRFIKGDIRDKKRLVRAVKGADAVIHLACISNDPSFELDPALGKSINYNAFQNVIDAVRISQTKRFIVVSSTSQYGVQPTHVDVTEDTHPAPMTDYAKYKLECEKLLLKTDMGGTTYVFIRPATLAGYAPRMRFDLSLNTLTISALIDRKIRIFGGSQMRPVLNIKDMVRFCTLLLHAPREKIHQEAFNVGYMNITMRDLAIFVKEVIGDPSIELVTVPTNDPRSYHINTDKMRRVLSFECRYDLGDAVRSIMHAYRRHGIVDGLQNPLYYNIKRMKEIRLS